MSLLQFFLSPCFPCSFPEFQKWPYDPLRHQPLPGHWLHGACLDLQASPHALLCRVGLPVLLCSSLLLAHSRGGFGPDLVTAQACSGRVRVVRKGSGLEWVCAYVSDRCLPSVRQNLVISALSSLFTRNPRPINQSWTQKDTKHWRMKRQVVSLAEFREVSSETLISSFPQPVAMLVGESNSCTYLKHVAFPCSVLDLIWIEGLIFGTTEWGSESLYRKIHCWL